MVPVLVRWEFELASFCSGLVSVREVGCDQSKRVERDPPVVDGV